MNPRRWIAYDTFKLMVALILAILLLVLWMQKPAQVPTPVAGQDDQAVGLAATQPPPSPTDTVAPRTTATLPPQPTRAPTTAPTTSPPSSTPTRIAPTQTEAAAVEPPTSTPAAQQPTVAPTDAAAVPTLTPQPQATSSSCPRARTSHLAVGQRARVTSNLNLRSGAGMDKPVINVSLPSVIMEIIGGPVCIPHQGGAYLWWNVRYPDGQTGWSAEAALYEDFYFLEPVR